MKTLLSSLLVPVGLAVALAGVGCSSSQDHAGTVGGCSTPSCAQGIGAGGYSPVFPQDGSVDGDAVTDSVADSATTDTGAATEGGADADASLEAATDSGGATDAPGDGG